MTEQYRTLIPAQAGIQWVYKNPRSDNEKFGFVRFAECLYCWFPAGAGMTVS
jgi:hypothetical protein